ncbi:MAG TPA: aminotransferase class I/II-fold pyridoxal phosphate-dependent enzyme [Thermoleophilaceae bacterium]|nr:aminotransferase class I/II-fold pyridoxal phosphate-dependent enzyme [Thermoleophilaceae bacterium]
MRRPARFAEIPGFGIDEVAEAAGDDPEVLRLENLDTDLPVPEGVIEATRRAVGVDEYNSYLPFDGRADLKAGVASYYERRSGVAIEPSQITITGGDGDGLNNALAVTTDVGDEVIVTDPTYAGMINRVRLAGAVPRVVSLHAEDGAWRLDAERLGAAVGPKTRALFLMNPAFPHGARLNEGEWQAVREVCVENDLWLIYWALYEGIVFDGAPILHPVSLEGMSERTVTVSAVSMEWRMIGWRVGWTIGPPELADDLGLAHIYNAVTPGGIGMAGAVAALRTPHDDLDRNVAELQRRRDAMLAELDGLPVVKPDGAWSMLMDCDPLGVSPPELSRRLIREKVAATPMTGWGGPVADRHIRFVFSNEPVERLAGLGTRVRSAVERG